MDDLKLYMILVGCKPPGRLTEQHDVFFGIGRTLKDLVPAIYDFWPEAGTEIHIDAWREVTEVDSYQVSIRPGTTTEKPVMRLFFLNLGGYRKREFEEYHYKLLTIAANSDEATEKAKKSAFYQHTGFTGAPSHVDDKYGVDVDDLYNVADILPSSLKERYELLITETDGFGRQDQWHIGYLPVSEI